MSMSAESNSNVTQNVQNEDEDVLAEGDDSLEEDKDALDRLRLRKSDIRDESYELGSQDETDIDQSIC